MIGLARLLVRLFFRSVEATHTERIASDQPMVVVADHRNGLVDGLVLMAALGRYPRFLGKSTLFGNPFLWPFLKLAGVVPIHRTQDGESREGNDAAFARANELLAQGGLVAVFPEGISHDQPILQALRTGTARIALAAAASGVNDVAVVAVTLSYDQKQRFRSRALVTVGLPEPVEPWMDRYRADEHRTVRALTENLAERLRHTGSDDGEWPEAVSFASIADIVGRRPSVLPNEVGLAERQAVGQTLHRAQIDGGRYAAMESLVMAYDSYRRDLDLLGLDDGQVTARYRTIGFRLALLRSSVAVIIGAPLAIVGALIHMVPFGLVKAASLIPNNEGMRATVKVVGSFFTYAATYVVVGLVTGARFGAPWGLLCAIGAPVSGYVAVLTIERARRIGRALAGRRTMARLGHGAASVLANRRMVCEAAAPVLSSSPAPVLDGSETP
jgi:glycerol-3-phosphate O-acyltransferase/dihydroxyacetone phosphate acyltransferase